jgi:DNA-binding NarL/FixJ family response regulator
MMLVEMIEEAGHSVVAEAGNVTKGAALATEAEFDLAILDINLGGDTIETFGSEQMSAEMVRRSQEQIAASFALLQSRPPKVSRQERPEE